MDDQYPFIRSVCIWIVILFMFWMPAKCNAGSALLYILDQVQTEAETNLSIEIIADVGTEALGSYDLAISFNHETLQFQSISPGKTPGHLFFPEHSIDSGFLSVSGVYQNPPRGPVSVLLIKFKGPAECLKLSFNIFVYGLLGGDYEMPVAISGYQMNHNSLKRLAQIQNDGLPLVDAETIKRVSPLVGIHFDQKSAFINQLIETIGEDNTTKYQSDILLFSRIAHNKMISIQCPNLVDIVQCLKLMAGMTPSTCNDLTGDNKIGLHDILKAFHQMAVVPD
ncbi:MAG: hypothetical protein HQK75_09935 [Candidatus Magnetomorum sp.]|nr:hypothetical protein [Candidatus Magnetomorum sp.]